MFIRWESFYTGATGGGTEDLARETADDWLRWLNENYPAINHWATTDPPRIAATRIE